MPANKKYQRLKTIRSSFIFQQQTLEKQIKRLHKQAEDKKRTLQTFDDYISSYEKSFFSGQAQTKNQFMNYQAFLNQIYKTWLEEKEKMEQMTAEKQRLTEMYHTYHRKIEVIEEALNGLLAKQEKETNKRAEQIEQEQWVQQNYYKKD